MDGTFLAFESRLLLDKVAFPFPWKSTAKARNVLDRFLVEPAAVGLVETTHGAEKTQQVQHVWMWSVSNTKTTILGKCSYQFAMEVITISKVSKHEDYRPTCVLLELAADSSPLIITCRERSCDAQLFLTSSKQAGTMKHQQSFIGTKSTCGASMWASKRLKHEPVV